MGQGLPPSPSLLAEDGTVHVVAPCLLFHAPHFYFIFYMIIHKKTLTGFVPRFPTVALLLC